MSQKNLCRLCLKTCKDSKSLYDDVSDGVGNEFYELVVKYFHAPIVDLNKCKHLKKICWECWKHLHDFDNFQAQVAEAQKKLQVTDKDVAVEKEADDFEGCAGSTRSKLRKHSEEGKDLLLRKICKSPDSLEHKDVCCSSYDLDEDDDIPPTDCQYLTELDLSESEVDYDISPDYQPPSNKKTTPKTKKRTTSCSKTEFTQIFEFPYDVETDLSSELELTESDENEEAATSETLDSTQQHSQVPLFVDKSQALPRKTKREYLEQLVAKFIPIVNCIACGETYPNLTSLQNHFHRQHPKEKFQVECCNLKLPVPTRLREHLIVHDDPDAFKCKICGRNYSLKSGLLNHLALRHPESTEPQKFPCKLCAKTYNSVIRLNFHIKVTHAKHQSEGRQRRRRFRYCSQEDNLLPDDPNGYYTCSECGKKFNTLRGYRKHQWQSHNIKTTHSCPTCGRTFKLRQVLQKHMAIHTGYSCKFCSETFTKVGDLYKHRNLYHLKVKSEATEK
ncbi:uncharacterized protein isoform X5 [Musca autumnalis]|uniref:uncharacterized protein isoform X5 n=1 Tax=Musca autumnalis TaxID=221902 RepID=UPI003CE995B8